MEENILKVLQEIKKELQDIRSILEPKEKVIPLNLGEKSFIDRISRLLSNEIARSSATCDTHSKE